MPSSNDFVLNCSAITSISYIEGSFAITSGQKASPPPTFTSNGKGQWTISIDADRQGSGAVAQGYNATTGGANHEYTNAAGDKQPETLNFSFGVNLAFSVNGGTVVVPVYLAQGHYTANNNWWFGGNTVINTGDPLLHVISGSSILATYRISGSGNYTMTLTLI